MPFSSSFSSYVLFFQLAFVAKLSQHYVVLMARVRALKGYLRQGWLTFESCPHQEAQHHHLFPPVTSARSMDSVDLFCYFCRLYSEQIFDYVYFFAMFCPRFHRFHPHSHSHRFHN